MIVGLSLIQREGSKRDLLTKGFGKRVKSEKGKAKAESVFL